MKSREICTDLEIRRRVSRIRADNVERPQTAAHGEVYGTFVRPSAVISVSGEYGPCIHVYWFIPSGLGHGYTDVFFPTEIVFPLRWSVEENNHKHPNKYTRQLDGDKRCDRYQKVWACVRSWDQKKKSENKNGLPIKSDSHMPTDDEDELLLSVTLKTKKK